MTVASVAQPRVLADLLRGGLGRDVALIIGSAALVGGAAQVAIPLPFTPVPLSLQTFAVLLSAAALGPLRAGAGMLLYLVVGAAGFPWFAAQNAGIGFPSFGYIVGFVLAAVVVGLLAGRGADRTLPRSIGLMVIGNLLIYAIGVPYLAIAIGTELGDAFMLGALPFLVGDGLKILLAAGLLPTAWHLVGRDER